jgi:hypothetical protein
MTEPIVPGYRPVIARGTAGDCCVWCGKVGINLPIEHGCKPNVTAEQVYGIHGDKWNWDAAWEKKGPPQDVLDALNRRPASTNGEAKPVPWIDPKTGEVLAQAPPKLMAAQLAGIARKVAETPEGERNSILHWAWCRLVEQGHPPEAWNVVAAAARQNSLPEHEIYKTLRWNKGVAS